jgi:MFS family permease
VIFVRMPVSESYLTSEAPARSRSLLLGIYFLGSSVGGGVFTPLIGAGIDRFGFGRSFALLALILLVVTAAASAGLLLSRPRSR